jgi:hypothetical protein
MKQLTVIFLTALFDGFGGPGCVGLGLPRRL